MIGQENPQRRQVLGMVHDGAVAKNGAWLASASANAMP